MLISFAGKKDELGQKGRGILSQTVEKEKGSSTTWDKIPRPFCPRGLPFGEKNMPFGRCARNGSARVPKSELEKEMRKVTESLGRGPNQSLLVSLC